MPRDPKVNSLVKVEAKSNKLEGTVDVLQDRPEYAPDLSGSYVVLNNQDSIFTSITAYPNGKSPNSGTVASGTGARGLHYQPFRRGMNPAVGVFGSPFQAIDFNILQTFEEASNLDDRFISGTTKRAYLTEEGKYADNALPYKRREFTKELDIKWSGRRIDGLAPITTSIGPYSTVSPNWQRPLSPQSSVQFQTGNLWIQQPIENLWQGDEVIWKLTSGSGFEQGDRVGRNLITGIVGPSASVQGSIPVIDGVRTTGSSVVAYGTGTSQARFLAGGAIRDNSSSRTYGSHFRPANNSTIGERFSFTGATVIPYYNATHAEHSGKLLLSTKRKTLGYPDYRSDSGREDEQSETINKLRSAEYVSDLPPLKSGSWCALVTESDLIATRNATGASNPLFDDSILQIDLERNIWLPYDTTELTTDYAVTSSLSAQKRTFAYSFTGSFPKLTEESTYLPSNGALYLGSPIKLYFGENESASNFFSRFKSEDFSKFDELVLLTSRGQVFLKRDLNFTASDFAGMNYLDFSDERLFFAQEEELSANGNSKIQIKKINKESLVEVVGAVGIFDFNASNSEIYKSVALQYYKKPATRHFYFNATGHKAHLMGADPYSHIVLGTDQNPARDPAFLQAEGEGSSVWSYRSNENVRYAIDKDGVAKLYFSVYNPQLGQPHVIGSKLRKISNLVSEFSKDIPITSSQQYNFNDAASLNFSNKRTIPFVGQALCKSHKVQPINTEESKDLRSIGFIQDGEVPIIRFSDKYETETDAFGNGYLSDIPSDYIPYFDQNGNVEGLFGSSFTVRISKSESDDAVDVGEVSQTVLNLMERTPNFPVNFDSDTSFGYAPYNAENKNGVAYRAILGKAISQVSSSFVFYAPVYGGGNNIFISRLTLPRIGTYNLASPSPIVNYVPNQYYWFKDPTTSVAGGITYNLAQLSACAVTSSNFISHNGSLIKYPNALVIGSDKTTGNPNGFSDYDRGIITQSLNNPTKNKLHQYNSDILIQDDPNSNQQLGLFIHAKTENAMSNSTVLATSSIAMNYMYDNITNNSDLTHVNGGFSSVKFAIDERDFNAANRLFIKENPIFGLEMQAAVKGFNFFGNPSDRKENKMAFACYTISDAEGLYGGNTFSSQSLFQSLLYEPGPWPTLKTGPFVPPPNESFLNLPVTQSSPGFYAGTEGASLAYLNCHEHMRSNYDSGFNIYGQYYDTDKFFIHPKGGLNYAIGPTDQYFGTAVLDDESTLRQRTKKLSLYIENSVYQDQVSRRLDLLTPLGSGYLKRGQRDATTGSLAAAGIFSGLYGIPPGNYNWIFNIQDMLPPLPVAAWEPSQSPPIIFSPNGREGEDNGLRSCFYWNIPECEVNKSLFSGTISEIRNDNEIIVYGQYSGISGPDLGPATAISLDDLEYSTSDFILRISEADEVVFDPKPASMTGRDQYKGVFVADPSNPTLGKDGLNIEGGASVELPNGEKAQPFKQLRVQLQITKTMPLSNFTELCKLAVSYRPNSDLPDTIMEPVSTNGIDLDTWSPYPGEDYEDTLRFNTGFAFNFARVSSICLFSSPYQLGVDPGTGNFVGSTVKSNIPAIYGNVPYDPFSHDTDNNSPFIQMNVESVNFLANNVITYKMPMGYHSLLSFGESCGDFEIGNLTGTVDTYSSYDTNQNPAAINRSIIDQGNSINIINLAGTAIKTEIREE